MIGLGKTIKGSSKAIAYIQDDKQQAIEIDRNLLVSDSAIDLFWEMQHIQEQNRNCKNGVFEAVLSPNPAEVKNFTGADWRQLAQDFIKKMNLQDNQYLAYLHTSTGTPHLHIYANRMDLPGKNKIKAHNIDVQTQRAASQLARERNWKLANEVRQENLAKEKSSKIALNKILEDCLSSAKDFTELDDKMQKNGFKLHFMVRDKKITGFRITKTGEPSFSASREDAKPTANGFKLSDITRKITIKTIKAQFDYNIAEALKPKELTLEEKIEKRREHYRAEGMPEENIENMIRMEVKFGFFDRKSKTNTQEKEQKPQQQKKNRGRKI